MASFKYKVTNLGTRRFFGSFVRSTTLDEEMFTVTPALSVILEDVVAGSIKGEDDVYFSTWVRVELYKTVPTVPPPSACDLVIEEVITTNNTNPGFTPNGTAEIVINNPIEEYEFSLDNVYWQSSNQFTGLGGLQKGSVGGGVIGDGGLSVTDLIKYTAYVRKKADHTCYANQAFTIKRQVTFLFASAEVIRNTSVPGGSDGEARVKVVSGSGNYTVKFSHEATIYDLDSGQEYQSMVKVGLPAGHYSILVTDLANGQTYTPTIDIVDPQPAPVRPGSFVEVPFMNSIHFVREDLTQAQTPDNRLLVNQYYPGYKKTNYFQKVQKNDFLTTQFYTDYPNAKCELWNYETKKFVKKFAEPIMREQNIGSTVDYDLRIENHSVPGQSRVYFSVGPAPIPITIETTFEILNNADGFNGIYKPVTIAVDPNKGYEYIVINKAWTPTIDFVSATGRFEAELENFNVMEIIHTFQELPSGCYFMTLIGYDESSIDIWISEPIDLQTEHKKTNLIKSRNIDNAFGLSFAHGYTIVLRVPSIFGHIRRPVSERSTSRNSDWSLVKISGKKSRGFELRTYMLPPYMHEKLNVLFDTDYYTINEVQYQSNEDYADAAYVDRVLLANSSIKVEQTNWFDKFNSDDIGTVAEGGFIQSNGGFIRR